MGDTGNNPAGPFRPLGIDHVVVRVRDMERSIEFYGSVLGCVPERRVDELGLVQLRAGASLVDLVDIAKPLGRAGGAPPGEGARNMDHFALRIEPFDVAAITAHLRAQGVEPAEPARRYGAEGMGLSIYIHDPDGNVVELKGPPEVRDS